jgi:hypothetical protein
MNNLTSEQIAQNFAALADSVGLINGIVDGSQMADADEIERQETVQRNVQHMALMVAKTYWTGEDMTAVNAAVIAGNNYLAPAGP